MSKDKRFKKQFMGYTISLAFGKYRVRKAGKLYLECDELSKAYTFITLWG